MPLLSIIALCYNHEQFLDAALDSLSGLPDWVEVLVADDASTDSSAGLLQNWQQKQPSWTFVFNKVNQGNCKTFNHLLSKASGDWILDFATDDVLLPHQLTDWIRTAQRHPECGFCYADAEIFYQDDGPKRLHSALYPVQHFPEGMILPRLFGAHFICPPAVLFSKKAIDHVRGYNEALSYEDLDIWIRIARHFPVYRHPEPVIAYRKHPDSMSASISRNRNRKHLQSTITILKYSNDWKELQTGNHHLVAFIRYHLRLSFYLQLPEEAKILYQILHQKTAAGLQERLFCTFSSLLPGLTILYHSLKTRRDKKKFFQNG